MGTPIECDECNIVLTNCEEGGSGGQEPKRTNPKIVAGHIGEMVGEEDEANCEYECKENGSCTTKYVGPDRPGNKRGSCFPESFGGKCQGIPAECQECNRVRSCPESSK